MVGSGPWSDRCLSSPRVRPQQGQRDGGGGTFGLGAAMGLLAPLGCVWSPLLGSLVPTGGCCDLFTPDFRSALAHTFLCLLSLCLEHEGTFCGDGNVLYLTSLFITVDVCIRENSSNCRIERSMHFMPCNLKRDSISLLNC